MGTRSASLGPLMSGKPPRGSVGMEGGGWSAGAAPARQRGNQANRRGVTGGMGAGLDALAFLVGRSLPPPQHEPREGTRVRYSQVSPSLKFGPEGDQKPGDGHHRMRRELARLQRLEGAVPSNHKSEQLEQPLEGVVAAATNRSTHVRIVLGMEAESTAGVGPGLASPWLAAESDPADSIRLAVDSESAGDFIEG